MTNSAAQLIPVVQSIINKFETLTVDARELHAFLGVKRDFSSWIKGRVEKFGFVEETDFVVFTKSGENLKGGRPVIDYILTIDMAKQLSMVENNEKGRQIRKYFIACERRALEAAQTARDHFSLTGADSPRFEAKSTVKDRKPLKDLVNAWVSMAPLDHANAWKQVKATFGVELAEELRLNQIKPACAWVQERINAVQAATVSAVVSVPPNEPSLPYVLPEKDQAELKALCKDYGAVRDKLHKIVARVASIHANISVGINNYGVLNNVKGLELLAGAIDSHRAMFYGFDNSAFKELDRIVSHCQKVARFVEHYQQAHK